MSNGKWYKTGFKDALGGVYDPPMWPGNRDHDNYCEGHTDGDRQLTRDAEIERHQSEMGALS